MPALLLLALSAVPLQDTDEPSVPWVIRHQEEDGHWESDGIARLDHPTDPESHPGDEHADLRATALVTLLLIDQNSDLTSGPYSKALTRAVRWLCGQSEGPFDLGGEAHPHQVRDHALATLALVELLAASEDPDLRSTAARWVDALELARRAGAGWGAGPEAEPDALTTGWALVALRLADRAGVAVSRRALREGLAFQRSCLDVERGRVAMRPGEAAARWAPTALAVLAAHLAGPLPNEEPWITRARAALTAVQPADLSGEAGVDWESVYALTAATYVTGGRTWKDWSRGLKSVMATQDGHIVAPTPGPHETGGSAAAYAWWGLTASVYYRFAHVVVR